MSGRLNILEALDAVLNAQGRWGTVLVVTPDVEGGTIMQSHYLAAYAKAGIPGQVFDDVEKAKTWVLQAIG